MMLSYEGAQRAIAGAQEHARQLNARVTVALVDEGGFLRALGRMEGAPPLSVRVGRDGSELRQAREAGPTFVAQLDQLAPAPLLAGAGALLIRQDDAILGAIAVSGGQPDQDESCAAAGLAALAGPRLEG
jgi:glc operon protein GlcG